MTIWNFTASNGQLIKTLDTQEGALLPRVQSFMQPSLSLVNDTIIIRESGAYVTAVTFSTLGTIGGATPTDIVDAMTKLNALIPSSSGGSSNQYNNATVYDTVADLPLTFNGGTIHSISILSKTGETVIMVDAEETTLIEGQSTTIEADDLIVEDIQIVSCTGSFLATTMS